MSEHDPQEYDDDNEYDDGDCWQCGGEGYVANCQDEIGCVDPESGCDFCIRRCRVCAPRTPKQQADADALGQILADALTVAKDTP